MNSFDWWVRLLSLELSARTPQPASLCVGNPRNLNAPKTENMVYQINQEENGEWQS